MIKTFPARELARWTEYVNIYSKSGYVVTLEHKRSDIIVTTTYPTRPRPGDYKFKKT